MRPGFVRPDFTLPIDVGAQKKLVQPGATVKGMQLAALVAERAWPDVPPREGLRRLGRVAYPTLRESLVGRVVFGALGRDIHALWKLVPKGYEISNNSGRASVLEAAQDEVVLRLEGMYSWVDAWHVGIIEGGVEMYGLTADVLVDKTSPTSADFWVRWR